MKRFALFSLALILVMVLMSGVTWASPAKKYSIISFTMDQTQAHVTIQSYGNPTLGGRFGIGSSPNGHSG